MTTTRPNSSTASTNTITTTHQIRAGGGGLADLLGKQYQVLSRSQALTVGMTRQMVKRRIREGGPWQRLLPGVYLTVTGTPTVNQRDVAALLYAGPSGALTGPAALRRLGIRVPGSQAVDVLVPGYQQRQSTGFVVVHRTARMPGYVCVRGPIRFTLPPRAVADTARSLTSLPEVRAVVAGAVQRRQCTLEQLTEELRAGPTRGSGLLRIALAEVSDGVRSAAEAVFRDLLRRSGLPMPLFNPRLYQGDVLIAVPDAWWPDAGLVAEVDSREWHLLPGDWERTMRRHDLMTACGIRVLHFSPRQVHAEPAAVIGAVRTGLDPAHSQVLPGIRTVPAMG